MALTGRVTWAWVAGFAALGFAVAALVQGYREAAVIGGLIAGGVAAWRLRTELLAERARLRRARADIAAERARELRTPRSRRAPAGSAPPWDPARVPELDALYRPDGGPSFMARHGHRPDEPCPPACPGNPFKGRPLRSGAWLIRAGW